MKKGIAIVLSVILVFALAAVSFAGEKVAPDVKAAETKAAPAEAAKPAVKQVTGEVSAVDAKANTITVKGKKGDVTASLTEKTKVMAGKEAKTIADVKAGEKVTLKYFEEGGKNVAKKILIVVAPEKAEKKEAPAAAPAKKTGGY